MAKCIRTYKETSQTALAAQSDLVESYVGYAQNNHCFANTSLIMLLSVELRRS